jgi:hypothetical protein
MSFTIAAHVGPAFNNCEPPMSLFRSNDFDDRRKTVRHDLHYLAQIDRGGDAAPLSCIISDISVGGAKLTVGAQEVPDEFTIVFRRRCRVVRRSDGQIGVQFVQS